MFIAQFFQVIVIFEVFHKRKKKDFSISVPRETDNTVKSSKNRVTIHNKKSWFICGVCLLSTHGGCVCALCGVKVCEECLMCLL